ncbi:MAG: YHYH protein [Bacteroidota bacterium]
MKKRLSTLFICLLLFAPVFGQGPEVTSWMRNTTNDMYMGALTDVAEVWYTNSHVYIKASGIPSYFASLVHTSVHAPADQNYIMELPRNPVPTANGQSLTMGFRGIWTNGTYVAGQGDNQYYDPNSQGLTEWGRVAWYFEGIIFSGPNPTNSPFGDFDESLAHSTASNQYHYHVYNAGIITDVTDSAGHSPIVGYAFDGYPIYGPYGYSDPNNPNSSITRIKSSYQKRNMMNRNFLPDGSPSVNPPPINPNYPIGCFIQDYEYLAGSGHLDQHNGRLCVTPEYPDTTYAYFVTLDDTLGPAFPYNPADSYYGETNHMGPTPTVNTIPGNAVQYTGTTALQDLLNVEGYSVFPNPVVDRIMVNAPNDTPKQLTILSLTGQKLMEAEMMGSAILDLQNLPAGMYVLQVKEVGNDVGYVTKVVKR